MSDAETRLYGLMEIADQQQAAVQVALTGLTAEREALARERQALAQDARTLQLSTQAAVRQAVTASMVEAATEGMEAVRTATGPLLGRLDQVTEGAERAKATLRQVILWASWRWLGGAVAVITGAMVFAGLLCGMALWWEQGSLKAVELKKAQMQAEIAEMQSNYDTLKNAGALGRVTRCTPGNRPCIQVDEAAGLFGAAGKGDYRVIQGY